MKNLLKNIKSSPVTTGFGLVGLLSFLGSFFEGMQSITQTAAQQYAINPHQAKMSLLLGGASVFINCVGLLFARDNNKTSTDVGIK